MLYFIEGIKWLDPLRDRSEIILYENSKLVLIEKFIDTDRSNGSDTISTFLKVGYGNVMYCASQHFQSISNQSKSLYIDSFRFWLQGILKDNNFNLELAFKDFSYQINSLLESNLIAFLVHCEQDKVLYTDEINIERISILNQLTKRALDFLKRDPILWISVNNRKVITANKAALR